MTPTTPQEPTAGARLGRRPMSKQVVPASALALTHLGRPLPGAPMLGGFAALTDA
jgi:pyruvate ferredoxin oxidoreductase gamma subunit